MIQHTRKLSYLRRAHGFAVSLDSDDVETRMMSNYTLKRELAEFAASLVQPGETIFIENGSSNALLARTLGEQKKNVTIITVSSYIAHLLKDAPCEVILLGGVYQKKRKYGWPFDTPVHPTGAFQQSIYWY